MHASGAYMRMGALNEGLRLHRSQSHPFLVNESPSQMKKDSEYDTVDKSGKEIPKPVNQE